MCSTFLWFYAGGLVKSYVFADWSLVRWRQTKFFSFDVTNHFYKRGNDEDIIYIIVDLFDGCLQSLDSLEWIKWRMDVFK